MIVIRFKLGLRRVCCNTLLCCIFGACLSPYANAADESAAAARVLSMTREHREVLSHALSQFDTLAGEQKTALRALDSRLEGLDPEVRSRYTAVLRRYHTLYNSLPKDRRKLLDNETNPVEKLKMLVQFKQDQQERIASETKQLADSLQSSTLVPNDLLQTGRQLIVWFGLDEPQDAKDKSEFAKIQNLEKRLAFVNDQRKTKPKLAAQFQQEFLVYLTEEERVMLTKDFEAHLLKLRADAEIKAKAQIAQDAKKKPELKAKETEKAFEKQVKTFIAQSKDHTKEAFFRTWIRQHKANAEFEAIRLLDNQKVPAADLARFEAALPPWAWESVDSLPPDAAQRRLKVLYRLVFPLGKEMPLPKAPAKTKVEPPKNPSPPASSDKKTPF